VTAHRDYYPYRCYKKRGPMNRRKILMVSVMICVLFSSSSIFAQEARQAGARPAIYGKIDSLTGAKGEFIEKEGVYKVGFPRSDLKVNVSGVELTPPMGLGVWASFKITGDTAMVMGDTVMTEDQVNPVMSIALENGLEVTAIHNHFFWDNPKIIFMHIGGHGDVNKLAASVGRVFSKIKETAGGKSEKPYIEIDPAASSLDPEKIEDVMGVKGNMSGGVYKVVIGRKTTMHNIEIGNAMGINTWAAFAGSDDKAVVDGDFVMLENEVQDVLKALRGAGINIVALHNHMLMESPRMVFLHFWGVGSTARLAKGLRTALDVADRNSD
jgi:hypothetical protein